MNKIAETFFFTVLSLDIVLGICKCLIPRSGHLNEIATLRSYWCHHILLVLLSQTAMADRPFRRWLQSI